MSIYTLLVITFVTIATSTATQAQIQTAPPPQSGIQTSGISVQAQDLTGQPAAGCEVQIGQYPHPAADNTLTAFADNVATTDASGVATFNFASTITHEPITISCANRPRISYLQQTGNLFRLQVPNTYFPQTVQISGTFTNWGSVGTNNNVDFGFLIPAIEKSNLLHLQMSDLISSSKDTITVAGKSIKVPSNIVIPNQKLHYGLIPVTLNKPNYRLPVGVPWHYSFVGVTGRAPFQTMVNNAISSSDFYELINDVSFYSVSSTPLAPIYSSQEMQISVNQNKLVDCMDLTSLGAPARTIGVLLDEKDTLLEVNDLKLLDSTPRKLKCLFAATSLTAASLSVDSKYGMSAIVRRDLSQNQSVTFDSFFGIPTLKNQSSVGFQSSHSEKSVKPVAYFAVLSDIVNEQPVNNWMIFSPAPPDGSDAQFTLPQLAPQSQARMMASAEPSNQRQRWEITWLGIDPNSSLLQSTPSMDFNLFEVATHAARNSVDFQP